MPAALKFIFTKRQVNATLNKRLPPAQLLRYHTRAHAHEESVILKANKLLLKSAHKSEVGVNFVTTETCYVQSRVRLRTFVVGADVAI